MEMKKVNFIKTWTFHMDLLAENGPQDLYHQVKSTAGDIFALVNNAGTVAYSIFNPILMRGLVLGYLLGAFYHRPLVKKGGIVVAYNPGIEEFYPMHHPSFIDLWQTDIEKFYDPEQCWNELSESVPKNPEYIRKYWDHYAYHGAHCLINWMWSGMELKHPREVILAGAIEPDTARKIGFTPVKDFDTAVAIARERVGSDAAIVYQFIHPALCVDVADDQ